MTADNSPPGSYADDLARLDEATAEVRKLRAKLAKAEQVAAERVAAALHSCLAEGRNRTEVQLHSPFSAPTARKIGEKAGVPPDERYVRTVTGKAAVVEPSIPTVVRLMSRADELRAMARDLTEVNAARIADELAVKHARTLTIGKTPRETIDNGIRAGLVTTSDLR